MLGLSHGGVAGVNRLSSSCQSPVVGHARCAGPCSTSGRAPAPCLLPKRERRSRRCYSAAPWTKEDLQQMSDEVDKQREEVLGESWRSSFADDPMQLADYVEQAEYQWFQVIEMLDATPKTEWAESGLYSAAHTFPEPMANDMVGMGTWRLKGDVDPAIEYMVQRLEGTWREMCKMDLNLYPEDQWKGLFDICDSMDPERELDGWSYADVPDPEPGQEGYPRLLLENRIYCSKVFRKLHLEVGLRQDGLEVLHAVMYPRYSYDIPILALDLVVSKGRVTLAIIDACPVRKNKYLPPHYLQTMIDLQKEFLTDADNQRKIPEWGKNIFSPACVCIQPKTAEDLAGFIRYALALHRAHFALSTLLVPIIPSDPRSVARLEEIKEGHRLFCENQLANTKTTRVLEAAFGKVWTDLYMHHIMFDFSPDYEPPFEDSTLAQLYEYFDYYPELGSIPEETRALEDSIALKRAEEVLDELATGQTVRQDRVEQALQDMYERDLEFRSNCDVLMPQLAELDFGQKNAVGKYLAQNLAALGLGNQQQVWTL